MEKLKRVVLKEELIALTENLTEAIVLNQMIYWSERKKDTDAYLAEENQRMIKLANFEKVDLESSLDIQYGWIYKSSVELAEELMGMASRSTIGRALASLVKKGWISERRNPKYNWDKTKQYHVNLTSIQVGLFELPEHYFLEGYPISEEALQTLNLRIAQNDHSNAHGEQSNVQIDQSSVQIDQSNAQNDQSNVQIDQAIPDITSQITSHITAGGSIHSVDDDDSINSKKAASNFDHEEKNLTVEQKLIADSMKNNLGMDYLTLTPYQQNELDHWVSKTELQIVLRGIIKAAEYGGKTFPYLIAAIETLNNDLQQNIATYASSEKNGRESNHVI